jgi:hypothetical protein
MLTFRPSFAYWPRPQFLGDSTLGFAAWIVARNSKVAELRTPATALAIMRLVEEHHDCHARTIVPTR